MQRLLYIMILVVLMFFEQESSACTAFCLKTGNEILLEKNLDWEIESGYLFLNEKGVEKSLLNNDSFRWKSKYRSITFNQFGKEFPLGGMNEQRLVIEELNTSPVKLIPDSSKQCINEFQLVQYLLDNCNSVDETIVQLKEFQLKPLFQSLHYIVADQLGNVIVVEFNGSDFNSYFTDETGFPILSNNNYYESLKYLAKFQGFGGDIPIKNRQGSNERFVSVANLMAHFNNQNPINYSFQILDTVKQNDTKWSLVYDIKNLEVRFKFHSCKTIKVFDFKELLELESFSGLGGNLSDCCLISNKGIIGVTSEENTQLIRKVFSLIEQEAELKADNNLQCKMTLLGNKTLNASKNEE